jgi:hypothetical protein
MKEQIKEIQKELYESLKDTYKIWSNNVKFDIVEDDFIIKEDKDWGDYLYLKIDRKTYEIVEIKTAKNMALKEINNMCDSIVEILKKHEEKFNQIFGVKLNTIEDFKKNIKMLLDSAIDRKYVLGKTTKKKNWDEKEYYNEYGLIFNPNGSLWFTFEDDTNKDKFYIEFSPKFVDTELLSQLMINAVENNKVIIEKYLGESKVVGDK